jgi:tryptophan halogenase
LQQKIELFTSRGHLDLEEHSVLPAETWVAALLSAGFRPRGYHGLLDYMDAARLEQHYGQLHQALLAAVARMPEHRAYLRTLRN